MIPAALTIRSIGPEVCPGEFTPNRRYVTKDGRSPFRPGQVSGRAGQVSRMISLISRVVPAGVSASALSRFMISM